MSRRRALPWVLASALLCVGPAPSDAAEVAGVSFRDVYETPDTSLRLQGVGLLRYRTIFKGYAAALYLGEGVEPSRALGLVPRRLEIEYFWSIPAKAFARITIEGIEKSSSPEQAAALRDEIAAFNRLYRDVEPGDRYSLTYLPGSGTELALNGEALGSVAGDVFSAALFAIWLGPRALDADLRTALLAVAQDEG